MKLVGLSGLVVAFVALVFGLHKTVMAAGRFVSPPPVMSGGAGLGRSLKDIVVRRATDSAQVDLGALNRTLLLVFDPECGPCNDNMANWIDLLAESRRDDFGVMALSLDRGTRAVLRDYWGSFGGRIPVFVADSAAIVAAGLRATPTTILIDRQQVVAEFVGVLNERESEHLILMMRSSHTDNSRK